MVYQPGDADTILADFGVPVSTGAYVGVLGLFDHSLGFQQMTGIAIKVETDRFVLGVKPGALGTVALDQLLTIDGAEYFARGPVEGVVGLFERHQVVRKIG